MKIKRLHVVIASLACLTVVSLAGSTLGTMAWYAYSTRATMAYQGTAVRKTEQLQIGLQWDRARDATYESAYGVSYEEVGEHSYYFMPAGTGFSSAAINDYLVFFGHATNEIPPLTSRTYQAGEDLNLYTSPDYTHPEFSVPAGAGTYVELPFVFRIVTSVSGVMTYVENQNIWLTDATASVSGTKDVRESIRIYVHNPDGSDAAHQKYILKPAADSSGSTPVGGLLDLNGDGFYDFDFSPVSGNPERLAEILYGTYSTERVPTEFAADTYDDINGTGEGSSNLSTFNAMHCEGVYGYASDYSDITIAEADYLCFDEVKPEETFGVFSGGYPIAHTSSLATGAIGRTTLTVYLEGWDHSIVNMNLGAKFNLGLQFEINRV